MCEGACVNTWFDEPEDDEGEGAVRTLDWFMSAGGQKGEGMYRCCNAEMKEGVETLSWSTKGRSGASKISPPPESDNVDAERGLLTVRAREGLEEDEEAFGSAFTTAFAIGAISSAGSVLSRK